MESSPVAIHSRVSEIRKKLDGECVELNNRVRLLRGKHRKIEWKIMKIREEAKTTLERRMHKMREKQNKTERRKTERQIIDSRRETIKNQKTRDTQTRSKHRTEKERQRRLNASAIKARREENRDLLMRTYEWVQESNSLVRQRMKQGHDRRVCVELYEKTQLDGNQRRVEKFEAEERIRKNYYSRKLSLETSELEGIERLYIHK